MSEKTEKPTPKKLRDARKKGEVALSKDVSKAFLVWGGFGCLILSGGQLAESMIALMQWAAEHAYLPFPEVHAHFMRTAAREILFAVVPFLGWVILLSVLGAVLQTGVLIAPDKVMPSLNKLNVVKNLKEIFSARNLVEALKAMCKVAALAWLSWYLISHSIGVLMQLPPAGIHATGVAFGTLLKQLLVMAALVFTVFAAFDWAMQRFFFLRRQRMSKEDVKREHKDMEGDPHMKGHRKKLRREIVMEGGRLAVQRASVVVANPTHFAVALRYQEGETPLPVVLAKGAGVYALGIIEEARGRSVPVVQNIPLARALMADADIDAYVPVHLLEGVAEVLRAVRELTPGWD